MKKVATWLGCIQVIFISYLPLFAQSNFPVDDVQGPICVLRDSINNRTFPLAPEVSQYNVVIADGFAHIRLTQMYVNRFRNIKEIAYVFPLPHEGSVHAMQMEYKKSLYISRIYDKQEAINRYDSIRNVGGTVALLLQSRPNVFQQKLANIKEGDTAYVRIEVSLPLRYNNGVLEMALPTRVAQRYESQGGDPVGYTESGFWNPPENTEGHRLQINVLVQGTYPIRTITSPTHALNSTDLATSRELFEKRELLKTGFSIDLPHVRCAYLLSQTTYPNRDFVLRIDQIRGKADFSLISYMDPNRTEGYFAFSLFPHSEWFTGNRAEIELVLMVDISGSQMGWPLEKEKEISQILLGKLKATDRLSVLSFNNSVSWAFGPGQVMDASAQNINTARNFIAPLSASGGTELLSGVQQALAVPQSSEHKRIYIFLTDGFITNETAIFDAIRNHPSKPTVFTFGAGNNLNRYFLDEAAKLGNGFSVEITQLELTGPVVDEAWEKIEKSAMENITLEFDNPQTRDLILPVSQKLYAGQAYTVYGKYDLGGIHAVRFKAFRKGYPITIEKKVDFAAAPALNFMLPQIWARQKIRTLELQDGRDSLNKQTIIQLSEDYQVLSKYTAFLTDSILPVGNNSIGTNLNTRSLTTGKAGVRLRISGGYLWFDFQEEESLHEIRIYDLTGRLVFTWSSGSLQGFLEGTKLKLDFLRNGLYFLQIRTDKRTYQRKVHWRQ